MATLGPITSIKAELGEGPVWHIDEQVLYFIDIVNGKVFRIDESNSVVSDITLPTMVGCVIPMKGGGVVAFCESGQYSVRFDAATGSLAEKFIESENLPEQIRFNDGKCSPAGSVWVGTMHKQFDAGKSALFKKRNGETTELVARLSLSNGLDWNPSETIFYHLDTPTNEVAIYHYDKDEDLLGSKTGTMSFAPDSGYPDGMCVDAEGMVWIAHFTGGAISRWNPHTKNMLTKIKLPVTHVSSLCFGGPNLNEIYVTTASEGFSPEMHAAQPDAGRLFKVETKFLGKPAYLFEGKL